jgi:hypothetical protein
MKHCWSCHTPDSCDDGGCYGNRMVKQQADAAVIEALRMFVEDFNAGGTGDGLAYAHAKAKAALALVEAQS